MALRLDHKPWQGRHDVVRVPGHVGVFALADAAGTVLYIGVADARSLFGLRGAIEAAFDRLPAAHGFVFESTSAYHTRWRELLMVYQADHGGLPAANPPMQLGTLHP